MSFSIPYYQCVNEAGDWVNANKPSFSDPHLITLYKMMCQVRLFDAKSIALQRTGRLGTYASTLGQEAIGVGIGAAMQKEDVFAPYYRDYGAQFMRGVKMAEILNYWGGDERGNAYENCKEDLPMCVPIASQTLQACGIARAMQLRKQKRAVVVTLGDGATSRGDFYESLNVAGVWKLPIVFVVNNNGWAISVPLSNQTACKTLAQKGVAGQVAGEQVDGNDVIVINDRVQVALEKAYAGKGPTVVEALTYRLCDHTTSDDANRYRPKSEYEDAQKKEPLVRMKKFLIDKKIWSEQEDQDLQIALTQKVNQSVKVYFNTPTQAPTAMFDHLYETLPAALQDQYERLNNA